MSEQKKAAAKATVAKGKSDRLSEALRENLKRRKAQARSQQQLKEQDSQKTKSN